MNTKTRVSGEPTTFVKQLRPSSAESVPTLQGLLSNAEHRLSELLGRSVTIRESLFGSGPPTGQSANELQQPSCYYSAQRLHDVITALESELNAIGERL